MLKSLFGAAALLLVACGAEQGAMFDDVEPGAGAGGTAATSGASGAAGEAPVAGSTEGGGTNVGGGAGEAPALPQAGRGGSGVAGAGGALGGASGSSSQAGGSSGGPSGGCPVPVPACAAESQCWVPMPWVKPAGYRCGYQQFVCGMKQGFVTDDGASFDCSAGAGCGQDLLEHCGPQAGTGGSSGASGGGAGGTGGASAGTCSTDDSMDCNGVPDDGKDKITPDSCEAWKGDHDTCGSCERKCGVTQVCKIAGSPGAWSYFCASK